MLELRPARDKTVSAFKPWKRGLLHFRVEAGSRATTGFCRSVTGQAQGLVDLALRHLQGDAYKPAAAIWDVNGGALAWQGGTAGHYFVPWVPVTAANVDALMAMRKNSLRLFPRRGAGRSSLPSPHQC